MKRLFSLLLSLSTLSLFAADYYWVGGTGNWSDLSNWATTSGGNVTHAQVPTSNDDIIFDANSFSADGQTVTFNTDIVFFKTLNSTAVNRNINITGSKTVIISSFGSIDLGTRVTFNNAGIITFSGTSTGSTLNFGSNTAGQDVFFAGSGDWSLQGDLRADSLIQITRGTFNTNNFNVDAQNLHILSSEMKTVSLGSSTVILSGKYGDSDPYYDSFDTIPCYINLANLNFDAGTSEIILNNRRSEIRLTGNNSIDFHNVTFDNNNGRNNIRLFESTSTAKFNILTLNGSTKIDVVSEVNSLVLNRNKVYRFKGNEVYNIGGITASADCATGIIITSAEGGIPTTFNIPGGIDMSFVSLRDIHAIGGIFNAVNSTNLGNNNGWTFTNSTTSDFYWVGGNGNWTDPTHWSFTSGGPSSGCVPTGKDNAFFDGNSFNGSNQEVILNQEDVFIKDMIWDGVTGTPELSGNKENSLHITGSLRLDANMDHTFEGYYFFESSESSNTIEVNSHVFSRDVTFNGQSADWTILDDIYITWNLYHQSGRLVTGNNTIDLFQYNSRNNRFRHLDMKGTTFKTHDNLHPTGGYAIWRPEWNVDTENYSIESDRSTIEFNSVHYVPFRNNGPNRLSYNKIIFNSFGAEVNGSYWSDNSMASATIDSLIIYHRGQFYNPQEINYLEFTAGYDYGIGANDNFRINELNANGTCEDGNILIFANQIGSPVLLIINNDHVLERLILEDIHNTGSGNLTANNSVDNGNNIGWTIDDTAARVLYWVGDRGEWEDPNHWSLTSGGPPGECVPTSKDDVIFDENSFTIDFQNVYSDNNRLLVCHNMTWENVFGNPNWGSYYDNVTGTGFNTDGFRIYGSLIYDEEMIRSVYWHRFMTSSVDSVVSNGIEIPGIEMVGVGNLHIKDDLLGWNIYHQNGSLIFEDITVNVNYYESWRQENAMNLNTSLNNSTFHIGREYAFECTMSNFSEGLNFDAGTANIFLDCQRPILIGNQAWKLHRVEATRTDATAYVGNRRPEWTNNEVSPPLEFQFLKFAGNSIINSEIVTDTLIGAAGKSYTLESAETHVVNNYLQMIGNNCTPIQLKSSISGTLANLSMPSLSDMLVDFVEMADNNGIGGAEFIAGARSTDVAMSNRGWQFDDPPEYVETGFLGVDRALCDNDFVDLNAFNFSPNESYQWTTGSTDTMITVNLTGTYGVSVTFDNGCMIEDSIIILEPDDVRINLANDTIICDGTSIVLNGNVGIQGANYTWNDGTDKALKEIDQAGKYVVNAEVDGCISKDSIEVQVQEIPVFALGADQSLCEGQNATLNASSIGENYLWQDGSTDTTFMVNMGGLFWAESEINLCVYRDSVDIVFVSTPIAEIGSDTMLCVGQSLNLSTLESPGASYSWQDGTMGSAYLVNQEGPYVVSAAVTGCTNRDSIFVTFQEIPTFDLGEDQSLCEGQQATLDASSIGNSYLWQDGSMDTTFSVTMGGFYWAESEINSCVFRDSIEIVFVSTPIAEIGSDTTLCEGQTLSLSTLESSGATYSWQDGTMGSAYLVNQEGPYVVSAAVTGCTNSDSIFVTYQEAADFELGDDRQACENETVTISTDLVADRYMWSNGDASSSIDVVSPGVYRLSVQLDQCFLEDSVTVTFNTIPNVEIGPLDSLACEGEEVSLSTTVENGVNYSWNTGTISNEISIMQEGPYVVTADNNGCIRNDSIYVSFQVKQTLDLGPKVELCENEEHMISTDIIGDNYAWSNGGATNSITVDQSGVYTLFITDNVCTLESSVEVEFFEFPVFDLGPADTSLCDRETLVLNTPEAGLWQDGSISSVFTTTNAGTYKVVLSNNGCESSDSIQLSIKPLPPVDLGADEEACNGEMLSLMVPNGITDYSWEDGSNSSQRTIASSGSYWLEAIEDGCSNRDTINYLFKELPVLELGQDTTVCDDTGILLIPQASQGNFTWEDGSMDDRYQVNDPGLIRLTLENNGCTTADSVFISFRECVYFQAYIPNAISPNGDGNNDSFVPVFSNGVEVIGYNLKIYDRWGSRVYETNSLENEWDGNLNNKLAVTGVYIYVIQVSYRDDLGDGSRTLTGDLTIIN